MTETQAPESEWTKGTPPPEYKSGHTPYKLATKLASEPGKYGDPVARARDERRAADIISNLAAQKAHTEKPQNVTHTQQKPQPVEDRDPIIEGVGKFADLVSKYTGIDWSLSKFDKWRWNRRWK